MGVTGPLTMPENDTPSAPPTKAVSGWLWEQTPQLGTCNIRESPRVMKRLGTPVSDRTQEILITATPTSLAQSSGPDAITGQAGSRPRTGHHDGASENCFLSSGIPVSVFGEHFIKVPEPRKTNSPYFWKGLCGASKQCSGPGGPFSDSGLVTQCKGLKM